MLDTNTPPKRKNKKLWLIWTSIAFVIIFCFAYNYQIIHAYYINQINNHYHIGDKIDSEGELGILLCRITRNQSSPYDYNTQDLGIYGLHKDSLAKQKPICIGTYLDYKIVPIKAPKNKTIVFLLYAIKPNWLVVDSTGFSKKEITKGYQLIDNKYYIWLPSNY